MELAIVQGMINKNGVSHKKFWRPNLDWILNMAYDLPTKQPACLTWTSIQNVKIWSPTESNWPMWPMNHRGMTVPLHRSSRRCTSEPAKITLQIIFTRKKAKTCYKDWATQRAWTRSFEPIPCGDDDPLLDLKLGCQTYCISTKKYKHHFFFCCVNIPFHWKISSTLEFLG